MGAGLNGIGPAAPLIERGTAARDGTNEARKIAFDRMGNGEKVLLISGFPQTRLSWKKFQGA